MSLFSIVKSKIAGIKEKNPDGSLWSIVIDLIEGGLRILSAKVYLRKCTQVGRMVSAYGKPLIRNAGEIILGDEVRIWSNTERAKLLTGKKGRLIVGKNSRLNGVHIYAGDLVQIGENVRIAPYSIILDSDFHDIHNHFSDGVSKPVIIEDNVWIATRSTILKGVHIGKGAVVATGSVVTKNVPPYTVVAGVPAVVIRKLSGSDS